jgi:aminopeptidase N
MDELSKASNQDLERWTSDWLFTAGANSLQTKVECDKGRVTQAMIYQNATSSDPILRQHSVQLGFYHLDGEQIERKQVYPVLVSGVETSVTDAIGVPCPQFSFPNVDDWGYVNIDFSAQSHQFARQHIQKFPAAIMRLLLWHGLWQQVGQNDFTKAQFAALAQKQLEHETDRNVRYLLQQYLDALSQK